MTCLVINKNCIFIRQGSMHPRLAIVLTIAIQKFLCLFYHLKGRAIVDHMGLLSTNVASRVVRALVVRYLIEG